jgi:hypothetical protein
MSGSADLYRRLKNRDIMINASDGLGGWSDNYITPGGTHECHPDFVATPIGDDPFGFLVCRRKQTDTTQTPKKPSKYNHILTDTSVTTNQVYDLYSNDPLKEPRRTKLGGQPLALQDRRLPYQAHYQGSDYYRDPILYRGIGIEKLNADIGMLGYRENKYFFSRPPPKMDITQAVQPYELWKREQLRMKNFTTNQMEDISNKNTYQNTVGTF